MSASKYVLDAKSTVGGKWKRYGRHKRTGKFVRWASPYGKLLRSRRKLDGKVARGGRDAFHAWAKSQSMQPRSQRVTDEPPLRERALAEGRKLLGVVETGGNNRGPEVDRIIKANGGVLGEPWCGDFVAYAYREAGSKSVQRGWASTPLIGRLAGQSSHGARAGRTGDLVVFDFPGGGMDSDHVGLLHSYLNGVGQKVSGADATHVRTLDGNTRVGLNASDGAGGEGVAYVTRPISLVNRTVRVHR